ncbi:MAG: hypothetical protein ACREWG_14740 [Gammaproteobacteria bacterium]
MTLPFLDSMEAVKTARGLIERTGEESQMRPIVFATMTDPGLLHYLEGSNALILDLFSTFLKPLEAELLIFAAPTG